MAKGNLFKGKSSGRVGDIVFYSRLGVPVQRALNRHPSNPRTPRQQANRSRMAVVLAEWARCKAEGIVIDFPSRPVNFSNYLQFVALNLPRVDVDCPSLTSFIYTDA